MPLTAARLLTVDRNPEMMTDTRFHQPLGIEGGDSGYGKRVYLLLLLQDIS